MRPTPSTELLLSLVSDVYAAAAEPVLWQPFLQRLETVTGSSRSYILSVDGRRRSAFACSNGFDPVLAERYNENFAAADPLVIAYERARSLTNGDFVGSRPAVMGDAEYSAMPMFHEIIAAQDDLHLCVIMAQLGPMGSAALALRRGRTQTEYEPEVIDLLAALTPHLRQALALWGRLEEFENRAAVFAGGADAYGVAVLALAADGRVLTASRRADMLLATGDGLLARGGELCAARPGESTRLKEMVRSAVAVGRGSVDSLRPGLNCRSAPQGSKAAGFTFAGGGAMLITRRPPQKPLRVSVVPFTSHTALPNIAPAAMVFIDDDTPGLAGCGELLRLIYQATPTESRVAERLLGGADVQKIADELRTSQSAVRFHLKSLFRRTGTRRQSELVRLLVGLTKPLL